MDRICKKHPEQKEERERKKAHGSHNGTIVPRSRVHATATKSSAPLPGVTAGLNELLEAAGERLFGPFPVLVDEEIGIVEVLPARPISHVAPDHIGEFGVGSLEPSEF